MPKIATAPQRRQARLAMDRRLSQARTTVPTLLAPRQGWIRSIRGALGMSAQELGRRLGVTQSAVARHETSEISGTIQLDSLRRVAEALNCDLVYALIPREELELSVQRQAEKRARAQLAPIEHSMGLEQQAVPAAMTTSLLEQEALAWQSRMGLWSE